MTNPELRIRCAEAMGWKCVCERWHSKLGPGTIVGFDDTNDPFPHVKGQQVIPAYDTDANAAVLLVAHLKEKGWHFRAATLDCKSGLDYVAQFINDEFSFERSAETLPLAICLAFDAVYQATKTI